MPAEPAPDRRPLPDRATPVKATLRPALELPDYLPARMLNEYVYCPRLFFYEWVEGVFAHSGDTVEGALRHEKLGEKKRKKRCPSRRPPAASASTRGR